MSSSSFNGGSIADWSPATPWPIRWGLCLAFQKRFEDFLRDGHTPFFDKRAAIRSPIFEIVAEIPS
jgi:hypothetical protein